MRFIGPEKHLPPTEAPEGRFGKYKNKIEKILKIAAIAGPVLGLGILGGELLDRGQEQEYGTFYKQDHKDELSRYIALRKELAPLVGEGALVVLEKYDKIGFAFRQEWEGEGEVPQPTIEGFEAAGLDPDKIKLLWNEDNGAYPKSWIRTLALSRGIRYVSEKNKVDENNDPNSGERIVEAAYENNGITFFGGAWSDYPDLDSKMRWLDLTFGHEICHANNWEARPDMLLDQRGELLKRVIQRMQSPNAHVPFMEEFFGNEAYGKEIQPKKPAKIDIRTANYDRAAEYLAGLCEDYFSLPDLLAERYPEDFRLVDEYIHRNDPNFDPIRASAVREDIRTGASESFAGRP